MATKEIPMEWGVLWQVATIPDDGTVPEPPLLPARPDLPLPTYDPVTGNPIPPELTEEQQQLQDQFVANLAEYQRLTEAREVLIDQALADPANWQTALSIGLNEDHAREMLKQLIEVNAGNKYARDFQLSQAPARIWVAVD